MQDPRIRDILHKGMRPLRLLWIAMLASLAAYILVCHIMSHEFISTVRFVSHIDAMRQILYLIALITILSAYPVRKVLLRPRTAHLAGLSFDNIPREHVDSAIHRYTTAVTVSLAMAESSALYGLVLFMLGDTFRTLYGFTGISIAAMIIYHPKMSELEHSTFNNGFGSSC
jgi:hypothetical protein